MIDYCSKKVLKGQKGSKKGSKAVGKKIVCTCFKYVTALGVLLAAVFIFLKYSKPVMAQINDILDLKIQNVILEGNKTVSKSVILKTAGIDPKSNLLLLDLGKVKNKISQNPFIKEVKIARSLPDKLSIKVKEREPYAILEDEGLWYVDEEGFPFKKIDFTKGESMDYPVLTGIPGKGREASSYRECVLSQAFGVLKQLVGDHITAKKDIAEINFSEIYGFSIYMDKHPFRVILGFESMDEKLKRLSTLLRKLKKNTGMIRIVDLDYSNKAIVKLRGAV